MWAPAFSPASPHRSNNNLAQGGALRVLARTIVTT